MTEPHYSEAYRAYLDLHEEMRSGRYTDHYGDGMRDLWAALERAGIVRTLALDPEPYTFQGKRRHTDSDTYGDWRFAPRRGYEPEGKYYR